VAAARLERQKTRPVEPGLRLLSPEIVPLDPGEEEEALEGLARLFLTSRSGYGRQNELGVSEGDQRLEQD